MIPQLNPVDFLAWRDAAAGDALPVVLDVREPWELQTASLRADGFTLLHIPMRNVAAQLDELQQSHGPDHPIACLCHHGIRSLHVADYLMQNGFTQVVNIDGGIDAWSQQVDPSVPAY